MSVEMLDLVERVESLEEEIANLKKCIRGEHKKLNKCTEDYCTDTGLWVQTAEWKQCAHCDKILSGTNIYQRKKDTQGNAVRELVETHDQSKRK